MSSAVSGKLSFHVIVHSGGFPNGKKCQICGEKDPVEFRGRKYSVGPVEEGAGDAVSPSCHPKDLFHRSCLGTYIVKNFSCPIDDKKKKDSDFSSF